MKAADCTAGLLAMEERRAEVPSLRAEAMVKVGGWMKDRERGRRRKEKRKEEKRTIISGGKKKQARRGGSGKTSSQRSV